MLCTLGSTVSAAPQAPQKITIPPFAPCTIVTKAQIEHAIGAPLHDPVPRMEHATDICSYENAQGNKVNIEVSRAKKRDLSNVLEQTKKALPGAQIRELNGLGDKAFLVQVPKGPIMVSVYRGGDALVVSVYGMPGGPKSEAAVEQIARQAYKRF